MLSGAYLYRNRRDPTVVIVAWADSVEAPWVRFTRLGEWGGKTARLVREEFRVIFEPLPPPELEEESRSLFPDKEAPAPFSVKEHPELRHVLGHTFMSLEYLMEAVEAIAASMRMYGSPDRINAALRKLKASKYSLDEVLGLVNFGSGPNAFETFCESWGAASRRADAGEGHAPMGETTASRSTGGGEAHGEERQHDETRRQADAQGGEVDRRGQEGLPPLIGRRYPEASLREGDRLRVRARSGCRETVVIGVVEAILDPAHPAERRRTWEVHLRPEPETR